MSALDARSLFAAAREDGPTTHEREAVFREVAFATGIAATGAAVATVASTAPAASVPAAAGAGASAGTVATASFVSMKLLVLGGLISALSAALAVALTMTVAVPDAASSMGGPSRPTARSGGNAARVVNPGAKLATSAVRVRDPNDAPGRALALASAKVEAEALARAEALSKAEALAKSEPPSDLAEEARLVTAARSALMAGDPARALSLVQATRKLSARALEPEELGLEARALRAVGRADDAAATELVLRRRYPDSALAR